MSIKKARYNASEIAKMMDQERYGPLIYEDMGPPPTIRYTMHEEAYRKAEGIPPLYPDHRPQVIMKQETVVDYLPGSNSTMIKAKHHAVEEMILQTSLTGDDAGKLVDIVFRCLIDTINGKLP